MALIVFEKAVTSPDSAHAAYIQNSSELKSKGFDKCNQPTQGAMHDWWGSTDLYYIGIYVGGVNRGCANSNLNFAWVDEANGPSSPNEFWSFLPTFVGKQDPCGGPGAQFSLNHDAAQAEGIAQADNAVDASDNLGFHAGSIIYFDLEAFNTTPSCVDAAKGFVSGWVAELHARNRLAGLYGSSCGSAMDAYHGLTNSPDDVWLADFNQNASVFAVSCVPDGDWHEHRLHQYRDMTRISAGGTAMTVDRNCARGDVATSWGFNNVDSACNP